MVAFFGAPSNVPDHALRACCTAVEMQNKLSELREKWENEKQDAKSDLNTKNFPPEEWHPGYKWHKMVSRMRMRIGINTGNIVVGNIGSTKRMNYTMMGDSVNLAARLECACKHYGIYTLASEHTLNTEITDENNEKMKVGDMIETRYIDNIIVKGKSEPVKVYEILALKGNLKENEKELVQHFHEGMRYYFDMKWDKAIAEFEASLKLEHENGNALNPSQVYIQRCKIYKDNPSVVSDEKWEGVFRLTKK